MADWAGLHVDILLLVLEKIRLIEDFVAFGCVCRSWREAESNNKHYLHPQIPWLMLVDREHCRQIYNLSKDYKSMRNLNIRGIFGKHCIALNYGWVLTVSRNKEMNLIHPLSKSRISLPNGQTLGNRGEFRTRPYFYMGTSCAALSANPSQMSNFVLMIVHQGTAWYLRYEGLGDQQWTPIPNRTPHISDLIYYHDRFYGIDYNGEVWGFNVSDPRDCFLATDLSSIFYPDRRYIYPNRDYLKKYIVAAEGDLLVVVRTLRGFFLLYKMDLINGDHKQIKSLGDRWSIFVGQSTSISVNVSESQRGLIKSNHIYFADDIKGCYSLEDGQFTKFKARRRHGLLEGDSNSTFWFIPSF